MSKATVKWFNNRRGYGFLTDPNVEGDIFVHHTQIQGKGFRTLTEGETVTYELCEDAKGKKARNVLR